MASSKRGRINVKLLGSTNELTILRKAFPGGFPRGWAVLAEFHGVEENSSRHFTDRGWLMRHEATKRYAAWLARGCLQTLDQRKAEISIRYLLSEYRDETYELNETVWLNETTE